MESRGCGKKLINSLNIIEENLETTPNQKPDVISQKWKIVISMAGNSRICIKTF